jgi:glutaredoxin
MKFLSVLLLVLTVGTAAAQTTYRWTDAEGKLHFTDTPPPAGAAKKSETLKSKAAAADDQPLPYETRKAAQDFPVTLFASTDCGDPCQQGRDLLKRRGIPFAEKDVGTPDGQAAMQAVAGKEQKTIPVLAVGSRVVKGFLAQEWGGLLDAVGYPQAAAPR